MYIFFAFLSAIFSSMTTLLSKKGLKNISSDTAVFLRTIVILFFLWGIVFVSGVHLDIYMLSNQNIIFLTLSGLSTGASWICYYKALSVGDVNKVVSVDKSSVMLTVIIGLIFLQEKVTVFKIIGILVLTVGIYLMINKKDISNKDIKSSWFIFASLSAIFAALTSIFAKIGLKDINSDLGTALRTCIVLIMAGVIVVMKYKKSGLNNKSEPFKKDEANDSENDSRIDNNKIEADEKIEIIENKIENINKTKKDNPKYKDILFLVLSGITTGLAWLCYFRALSIGEASIVAPIDKSSIIFTVVLSWILLKEKISCKNVIGLLLISVGVIFVLF